MRLLILGIFLLVMWSIILLDHDRQVMPPEAPDLQPIQVFRFDEYQPSRDAIVVDDKPVEYFSW